MMRTIALLAGAAGLAAVAAAGAGSGAPGIGLASAHRGLAVEAGRPSNEQIRQMRRNLLDLASRQEIHRSTSGAYTGSVSQLDFQPTDGVRVAILEAGASGWAGSATHPELSGKSCVVYFGDASPPRTAGGLRATRAAAVVCDAA